MTGNEVQKCKEMLQARLKFKTYPQATDLSMELEILAGNTRIFCDLDAGARIKCCLQKPRGLSESDNKNIYI